MMETFREFTFEAAHRTTPSTPLHGHTFVVTVTFSGEPHPEFGWSHDLDEIEPVIAALRKRLDHSYLNDIEGLAMPSLENVSRWIWHRLEPQIIGLQSVTVRRGAKGHGDGCTVRRPPSLDALRAA